MELEENINRLMVIIANYVGVNDIGYDALDELEPLFSRVKADQSLKAFWDDRFNKAKTMTKKFT